MSDCNGSVYKTRLHYTYLIHIIIPVYLLLAVSGTCIGFVAVFVAFMMVSKKLPGNTTEGTSYFSYASMTQCHKITLTHSTAITVEHNKVRNQFRKRAEQRLIGQQEKKHFSSTASSKQVC